MKPLMTLPIMVRRLLLVTFPLAALLLSVFIGRYPLSIYQVLEILSLPFFGRGEELPAMHQTVIWQIRLPRALLGAMVGASLSASGATFQGIFKNPLVSSNILGVSSGAGFGATLAIILFGQGTMIYIFAFLFGTLAVVFSYLVARHYRTTPTIMLVLGGVVVSSIFSSLISLAKYVADPYTDLPAIVFWLMGSLATARWEDITTAGLPMLLGVAGLMALRWRINVLSMGDKEAQSLGINTTLTKGFLIGSASLATTGAVCVSGIIGWVGLIIPHIARILVGNDHKALIPASMLLGAGYLVLVDIIARTLTGAEIPLGILTALIGGPFFIYLLKKTKGGGW
ncbi:FecCD family ABC transporter permease [Anoxynatronum buryatiense]|uniref:Iron complex transport system permease protein n=1 Tax=Anoxynatronum buryatiense TaxID=489973 RepID=A0AA45WWH6_9CLOT|nr:iron ABC transporter permease [Anoxynatronum buryatiense]SMP60049.1 iron complex transport system permease protein [Anoxynatronum buryatiense]